MITRAAEKTPIIPNLFKSKEELTGSFFGRIFKWIFCSAPLTKEEKQKSEEIASTKTTPVTPEEKTKNLANVINKIAEERFKQVLGENDREDEEHLKTIICDVVVCLFSFKKIDNHQAAILKDKINEKAITILKSRQEERELSKIQNAQRTLIRELSLNIQLTHDTHLSKENLAALKDATNNKIQSLEDELSNHKTNNEKELTDLRKELEELEGFAQNNIVPSDTVSVKINKEKKTPLEERINEINKQQENLEKQIRRLRLLLQKAFPPEELRTGSDNDLNGESFS